MDFNKWRLGIKHGYARRKQFARARTSRFDLVLDTSKTDSVGQVLSLAKNLERGWWEPGLIDAFFEYMSEDEVIVELGTWLGVYSVMLAKFVSPKGRLIGFEPDPAAYRQCVLNLALNHVSNAHVLPLAASNAPGMISLYTNHQFGNSGSSILDTLQVKEGCRKTSVQVPVVSLASILSAMNVTPTVLKIDIEGAEDLALEGAGDLLAGKGLKIFLEVHHDHLTRRGKSGEYILKILADSGKKIRFLDDNEKSPYRRGEEVDPNRSLPLPTYRILAW